MDRLEAKGACEIWPWLFDPNTWGPPKGSLWPRTLQDDRPPEKSMQAIPSDTLLGCDCRDHLGRSDEIYSLRAHLGIVSAQAQRLDSWAIGVLRA